jgi:hypothetical protein
MSAVRDTVPVRSRRSALAFAHALLLEQNVSPLAARTTARALALLLERSDPEGRAPVVLSAAEGAALCDFEPRTWWIVRRRLLVLGHLVAQSTRSGGRGHKAAYFVAPLTFEKYRNDASEMGPPETLNALSVSGDRSQHRHRNDVFRVVTKENTSDVRKLTSDEGDGRIPRNCERAFSSREILELLRAVQEEQARTSLIRLLAWVTLLEQLDHTPDARERLALIEAWGREPTEAHELPMPALPVEKPAAAMTPRAETLNPARTKRPRAARPLWGGTQGEEAQVFTHVRAILEWANRDFGASFDIERSAKDTLRYPYEDVRAAVANVLLKRARGYSFGNPGGVLWDAITLVGYRLEEFAVARFEEVLRRCEHALPAATKKASAEPKAGVMVVFANERRRREAVKAVYDGLPPETRRSLDERARALAERDLRERSGGLLGPEFVSLRVAAVRGELLEQEHKGALEVLLKSG